MHTLRNATRTTKMIVAAVAAFVVFAGVYGFAASLGLSSSGLSAGSSVVSSCGNGLQAAYTTSYASSISGYSVSQVNLSNIPAGCNGAAFKIQLTGGSGAPVGSEMTGSLPASGTTYSVNTVGTPDASLVTGISVVVS